MEVPHFSDDLNSLYIEKAFQSVQQKLAECGFFDDDQVLSKHHLVLKNAYPVLTKDTQAKSRMVHDYLTRFKNLTMTGRNGLVQYSHIHDHMENAFRCFDHLKK